MNKLISLADHARASRSTGRSEADLAWSAASNSKVTPFKPRASAKRTRASQYSGPIRPRRAHLETIQFDTGTPADRKSRATSSNEGQSLSTSLTLPSMAQSVGPQVLNVKANTSYDESVDFSENPAMDRMSETEERAAFIGRVRAAREARFPTQKPICTILGIDQGTYKQYESRTVLPHRFIPKFCAACGVTLDWLLTGEGAGPNAVPIFPPDRRVVHKTVNRPQRRKIA
jgi:hypothetical protein